MSVLFCHDHRFAVGESGVYSPGQYDQEILLRYEKAFGQVFIAARYRPLAPEENVSRLNRVFDSTERFLPMPNLSNLEGLLGLSPSLTALEQRIASVDVVIARLPSEIGLAAARIARRLGKPLAIEMVACARDGLRSHGSLKARLYAPLAYFRTKRAVASCPWVLYVTQHFLQSRYPASGRSVGVSDVRLPHFEDGVLEARLARIGDGPIRLGMIAALFHSEKGVDVAIRALALARKTSPDLTLRILGPGDPAPLRRLADELGVGEAVEFCGSLPSGRAVLDWLDGIDVYVQASFQEGLPRALIEAMSRATPALVSSAGGTPELVPAAYLHAPGECGTLAAQMLAIRDAGTRKALAAKLYHRSLEYSAKMIDPRRADFWREFCVAHGIEQPLQPCEPSQKVTSVLFCHDHRFVIGDSGIYSPGQFDKEILSRYEKAFGQVFIAARHRPLEAEEDASRLSRVFDSNERFLPMPNLSNLRGLLGRSLSLEMLEQRIASIDVVVARLPSEIGLAAAKIARRLGKPLIVEVVACVKDGLRNHGSDAARLYSPLAYFRTRRAVAACPWVLYVTQHFLQLRYPTAGRSVAASNVRLPAFEPGVLDARLGRIGEGPIRFGMVAALFHSEKGVDVAIRALAIARKTAPDLTLRILGPGDPAPLRRLADGLGVGEAVEFCGSLPRGRAVLEWLDGIDIYVQASFQEGLPRALIEAMSRAMPALASAAGGTHELVPSDCLHAPGDYRALAAQMLTMRDPARRKELAVQLYHSSLDYAADKIDPRRAAFWAEFRAAYRLPAVQA